MKLLLSSALLLLLFLFILSAALIYYAQSPALTEAQFPSIKLDYAAQFSGRVRGAAARLKIVTYNIGYASGEKNNLGVALTRAEVEKNLEAIAATLQELDADILLLQELDFDSARSGRINQLAFLRDKLKMPYAAYAVTWNKHYVAWPYWPPSSHFGRIVSGQAVLSRLPLIHQRVHVFARPRENAFWYNWFYLDRLAQTLEVQLEQGRGFQLTQVHLEAFASAARERQLKELKDLLAHQNSGLVIVGGDFNSEWSEAPAREGLGAGQALRRFAEGQECKLTHADGGEGYLSFPSWEPREGIDHLFFGPDWRLEAFGVGKGAVGSDHLPVWGVFSLVPGEEI